MVFKLSSGLEGYRIDNEVIMKTIRVQMGGDYDLVICSPHLLCGFHAYLVCFLRCDLAGFEALVSMVGNIATHLAELLLGGHHSSVGIMLGAVDGADIHLLIRLLVVLGIGQSAIQIIVQVLLICRLIRVFRIVDDVF